MRLRNSTRATLTCTYLSVVRRSYTYPKFRFLVSRLIYYKLVDGVTCEILHDFSTLIQQRINWELFDNILCEKVSSYFMCDSFWSAKGISKQRIHCNIIVRRNIVVFTTYITYTSRGNNVILWIFLHFRGYFSMSFLDNSSPPFALSLAFIRYTYKYSHEFRSIHYDSEWLCTTE